jgi:hypothetical protein
MKGQDIVILLKLACLDMLEKFPSSEISAAEHFYKDAYSVRGLGASLRISKTEIAASLNRSLSSGLAVRDHENGHIKPNRRDLSNFIIYGLKFVFPAKLSAPARGVLTSFSAPMLKDQIISAGQDGWVWPDPNGKDRGISVVPLFSSVPAAIEHDPALYRFLALIDAIRLGRQREANLAAEQLKQGLL